MTVRYEYVKTKSIQVFLSMRILKGLVNNVKPPCRTEWIYKEGVLNGES